MTVVVINPGAGPVDGSNEALAVIAMTQFVKDSGAECFRRRDKRHDYDGRFAFHVYRGDKKFEIDMPGLPIDKVRYVGKPQSALDFPRLYADGSSWLWCFAVSTVKDDGE